MASRLPTLKPRFFDANGDPLSGGKLYSYIAGTTTPLGTYGDLDGTDPNENPVVLDANGEAHVYMGPGSYKFVLTDADDVVQWTEDDVTFVDADSVPTAWATHAVTDGQVATVLSGETLDLSLYSSAIYDVEIIRGTATFATGQLAIQKVNSVGRVSTGAFMTHEGHGVTFSVVQVATVVSLYAQLSAGPGNGTIKLSRRLVAV